MMKATIVTIALRNSSQSPQLIGKLRNDDSNGNENSTNIKQLLDEVEYDIINYQSRGLCYLPKPKAEADNTDTRV